MTEVKIRAYTWEDLCKERIQKCTSRGLWGGFICNDGSGRSHNAANILASEYGINSFYFRQGLKHILEPEWEVSLPAIICKLNTISNLSVILTPQEVRYFHPILYQISCYIFVDSLTAANEMEKIITSNLPRFRF